MSQNENKPFWRTCSACKKPIGFRALHYVCSVSTCNGQRTGYVFCSVGCFEVHLPGARHKDAGAVEKTAPGPESISEAPRSSGAAFNPSVAPGSVPHRVMPIAMTPLSSEVLVIASRLKEFIQKRGDMNTSAGVMQVLSDHLRVVCDRAVAVARADGRKTVLDRDFSFLKER